MRRRGRDVWGRQAMAPAGEKRLPAISRATHLFEEPGALEQGDADFDSANHLLDTR